jgi:hypothetical protein
MDNEECEIFASTFGYGHGGSVYFTGPETIRELYFEAINRYADMSSQSFNIICNIIKNEIPSLEWQSCEATLPLSLCDSGNKIY